MKRIVLAVLGLGAVAIVVWAVGASPFGRAQAATFHVDFDHGKDEANAQCAFGKEQASPARNTEPSGNACGFAVRSARTSPTV